MKNAAKTLMVEVYFKMVYKSSKLASTFPLISMILTDMNLKAVLVFVLFVAESKSLENICVALVFSCQLITPSSPVS